MVVSGTAAFFSLAEWTRNRRNDWITPRSKAGAGALLGAAILFPVSVGARWILDTSHRQDAVAAVLTLGSLVPVGLITALAVIVWRRRPEGHDQPRLFPTMVMPSRLADAGASLGIRRVCVHSLFAAMTPAVNAIGIARSIRHG